MPNSGRQRKPQHRHRRERYPQEGMLLRLPSAATTGWRGGGSYLTLLAFIDDATGTIPAALFRDQEDAHGYFLLLRETIASKGIPLPHFCDRHSIFQFNHKQKETVEEQLAGERQPTPARNPTPFSNCWPPDNRAISAAVSLTHFSWSLSKTPAAHWERAFFRS